MLTRAAKRIFRLNIGKKYIGFRQNRTDYGLSKRKQSEGILFVRGNDYQALLPDPCGHKNGKYVYLSLPLRSGNARRYKELEQAAFVQGALRSSA